MRAMFLFAIAACLYAQSVRVYSEFARFDGNANPVEPEQPREILSPAIVRGGFTSFQIAVQVEKGTHYTLYIGQNPEEAVRVTLFRESGEHLEAIAHIPYEGDTSQVFWMDLWAARDASVRRIKVEPQLLIGGDWITYPMEIRVMSAQVPEERGSHGVWISPMEVMRSFVCHTGLDKVPQLSGDIAGLRFRNGQQDVALAGTSINARDDLRAIFGSCNAAPPQNPEWYLKIRDYLFKLRP